MSRFPEIVIDRDKNTPINLTTRLDIDQCYDFMHHTHNIEDIINSDTAGVKSLYEAWLALGNTGTEQDFINLLAESANSVDKYRPITNEEILALFDDKENNDNT